MFGRKNRTEVMIVGAGPVGRVLALALHARGIQSHVFEQEWRGVTRSYAAALHPSSLQILEKFDVLDEVLERALRIEKVAFYDRAERRAEIDLHKLETLYPFIAVIPQNLLEAILDRKLSERGIGVDWQRRVSAIRQNADGIDAEVEVIERYSSGYAFAHTELTVAKAVNWDAAFIVGTDGAGSFTRRNQGIKFDRFGAPEEFDVFEFESDDDSREVRVVIDGDLTNVLWTLPGGRQRWSFQVKDAGSAEREAAKSRLLMQVPGESSPKLVAKMLGDLIAERVPWFRATPGDIAWSGNVRFEGRLAAHLGKGRAWLAGDAAHQTGPVGVQSMNAGLVEAYDLGTRIAETLSDKRGPERLIEYESGVQQRWLQLLGRRNVIAPTTSTDAWIREHAARIVPCIPATDADLMSAAAQLGLAPQA